MFHTFRSANPTRSGCSTNVLDGLISAEEARRDYGVATDADGRLDQVATERLRGTWF